MIKMPRALILICVFLILCPNVLIAREKPYEKITKELISTGLSSVEGYKILEEFLKTAPSRQSGSPGAQKAVEWAKIKMERLGLSNVRLEPAMVTRWERGSVNRLNIVIPSVGDTKLNIIATGGSIGTPPNGITAEVVEIRSREEIEKLGDKLKGKIVFLNQPMDRGTFNTLDAYSDAAWQRSRAPSLVAKFGAVASISRSLTILNNDIPYAGMLRYPEGAIQIPAAAVSTKDADRLSSLIQKGSVRLNLRLNCRVFPKVESYNVIGDIVGTKYPNQIVLIGGHLDVWDNTIGANDDGAGVAHTLEAIRLIKELGLRPERTIRAVLFMDEEDGGFGGKAYAEAERKGEKHIAAIESDLGGAEPVGFSVEGKRGDYKKLKKWTYLFEPMNIMKFYDGDSGTDIWKLAEEGAMTIGMQFNMHKYFNYHHAPLDTVETINERELETGAIAMATLAYVLAEEGI